MSPADGVDGTKRATLRRFAAIGAASPLIRYVDSSAAETGGSDVRAALVGYVTTTPGAHFSKIRDDLRLGTGETQHHLRTLEERDVLARFADGEYRRYVLAERFDAFERRALGYLRRETPRGMIIALLDHPDSTASSLAEAVGVSRPTVSNYASDLEAAGLLSRTDGYTLECPETLLALLVRHADSFGDRAVALADRADELIRYDSG